MQNEQGQVSADIVILVCTLITTIIVILAAASESFNL